jgi:hypothetical protein
MLSQTVTWLKNISKLIKIIIIIFHTDEKRRSLIIKNEKHNFAKIK